MKVGSLFQDLDPSPCLVHPDHLPILQPRRIQAVSLHSNQTDPETVTEIQFPVEKVVK